MTVQPTPGGEPPTTGNLASQSAMSATIPPRRPMSVLAIIGFVLSLLMCIPLLMSLAGLVLGLLALPRTAEGKSRGRGLAAAAIALGALGTLVWIVSGLVGYHLWSVGDQLRNSPITPFVVAVNGGDIPAAAKLCTAETKASELQTMADYFKKNFGGAVSSVDLNSVFLRSSLGSPTAKIGCVVQFADGKSEGMTFEIIRGSDGAPDLIKVVRAN